MSHCNTEMRRHVIICGLRVDLCGGDVTAEKITGFGKYPTISDSLDRMVPRPGYLTVHVCMVP